jgi:hypothetical protein
VNNAATRYFKDYGSLPPGFPSYINRPADESLYRELKNRNFCYVLTARQMGKSSLRVEIMDRFKKEGYTCCALDLSLLGIKATQDQWYLSILSEIVLQLNLPVNIQEWWTSNASLTSSYRFNIFLTKDLIQSIPGDIILFFDEIDTILSLDKTTFNTDDFFAGIRGIYNQRVDNPSLNRINIVVIGVASPDDLMNDPLRTPFNTASSIQLDNFVFSESVAFEKGLSQLGCDPHELLKEIFLWTNGQPVLTQRLCIEVLKQTNISDIPATVKDCVDRLFLKAPLNIGSNNNLSTIDYRIKKNLLYGSQMLNTYAGILRNGPIRDETTNPIHIYLKLTGLLRVEEGFLSINNRIYANKFDMAWVTTTNNKILRPYNASIKEWDVNNKSESKALRGEELDKFNDWCNNRNDLTPLEKEFQTFCNGVRSAEIMIAKLNASIAEREREAQKKLDQERRKIEAENDKIRLEAENAIRQSERAKSQTLASEKRQKLLRNVTIALFIIFIGSFFYLRSLTNKLKQVNTNIITSEQKQAQAIAAIDSAQIRIDELAKSRRTALETSADLKKQLQQLNSKEHRIEKEKQDLIRIASISSIRSKEELEKTKFKVDSLQQQEPALRDKIDALNQRIYQLDKQYTFKLEYPWVNDFAQNEQDSIYDQYFRMNDTTGKNRLLAAYHLVSTSKALANTDPNEAFWYNEIANDRLKKRSWIVDDNETRIRSNHFFYSRRFLFPLTSKGYQHRLTDNNAISFIGNNEVLLDNSEDLFSLNIHSGDMKKYIDFSMNGPIDDFAYDPSTSKIVVLSRNIVFVYNVIKQKPVFITKFVAKNIKPHDPEARIFVKKDNTIVIAQGSQNDNADEFTYYEFNISNGSQITKRDSRYFIDLISSSDYGKDFEKNLIRKNFGFIYNDGMKKYIAGNEGKDKASWIYTIDINDSVSFLKKISKEDNANAADFLDAANFRAFPYNSSPLHRSSLLFPDASVKMLPYEIDKYLGHSIDGELLALQTRNNGFVLYDNTTGKFLNPQNTFTSVDRCLLIPGKMITVKDSVIKVWDTKEDLTNQSFTDTYIHPFTNIFIRDTVTRISTPGSPRQLKVR